MNTVVLVEGVSDQVTVETLARRRGRMLVTDGVSVVPIGGATNIGRALDVYGPRGRDLRLAGLYDVGEERDFRRGLERAGLGSDLEAAGFYACVMDLEDELIRCLGVDRVEQIVEAQGELGSFRTLQQQPAQRGRTTQAQLRRFLGTRSGRKVRYARLLAESLDLDQVPRPLAFLLAHL